MPDVVLVYDCHIFRTEQGIITEVTLGQGHSFVKYGT